MIDDKLRSRKWQLAVFFALANTVALFFGYMTDIQYIIGQAGILGLYSHFNIQGKKDA